MSEVKVETCNNRNCRIYETDGLGNLLNPGTSIESFHPLRDELRTTEKLTSLGKKIAENLKQIPGIVKIFFKNEDITIIKGLAFEWEDIEPQVIYILETLSDNPDAECSLKTKKVSPTCEVESFPNDCTREYHFNMLISSKSCFYDDSFSSSWELELPIRTFVEEIKRNPMITRIHLESYSIYIEKNNCSEWEEVDKFLKPIFEKFFGVPIAIECQQENALNPEMEQIVSLLRDAIKKSRDSQKGND